MKHKIDYEKVVGDVMILGLFLYFNFVTGMIYTSIIIPEIMGIGIIYIAIRNFDYKKNEY